jgi:O-antigen/teichoic acid export membrane protein
MRRRKAPHGGAGAVAGSDSEPTSDDSPSDGDTGDTGRGSWHRYVATGGAVLLAGNIVASVGFFVAVLLLARGLSPAERGTIAFLTVAAQLLARVAGMGTPQAAAVLAARRPFERPALLVSAVAFVGCVASLLALVACGGLWLLDDLIPSGIGSIELLLLAFGVLAVALSEAGYGFLLGCSRFRQQMTIQMTVPWLYAALLAIFYAGPGLTIARAALVWTVAMSAGAALLAIACLRDVGLARPDIRVLLGSIRFGLRAWVGSLSSFLNLRADQVLMGFIATEASLGVYAVAVNGAEVLLYLPAALGLALVPAIAGSDANRRSDRTLAVFRMVSLLTLPLVMLAALLGPTVLPAVFGSAYEASVEPFVWLLPGTFGFIAITVLSNALLGSGSPGTASLPPLAALVVGITLDLVLIPRYGATGAAIATTTASLAGGTVALLAYRARSRFAWGAVIPRMSDVRALRRLVGELRSRTG